MKKKMIVEQDINKPLAVLYVIATAMTMGGIRMSAGMLHHIVRLILR